METSVTTPEKLFGPRGQYRSPEFQRPYAWTQERQWEPLWDDIAQMADSILAGQPVPSHFIGAVVLHQQPSRTGEPEIRVIVDGQQRLVTMQLLLAAAQEALEQHDCLDTADKLAELTRNRKSHWSGNPDNEHRVWPSNENDQAAYRQAMSKQAHPMKPGDGDSVITQAYNHFKGRVNDWMTRPETTGLEQNRHHAAECLFDALARKINLVAIDLDPDEDPHIIFETLNARGTPLLQTEMVKNRAMHAAKGKQAVQWPFDKSKWWRKEIGVGRARRPRAEHLLNHWLTITNRKAAKHYDEFNEFKKLLDAELKRGGSVHRLVADLQLCGSIYQDIDAERHQFPILHTNPGTYTPIIMWLKHNAVPPCQQETALSTLTDYTARRIMTQASNQSLNNTAIDIIAAMHKAGPATAGDAVIEHLNGRAGTTTEWPSDAELKHAFLNKPFYNRTVTRVRLVLEAIEAAMHTDKSEYGQPLNKLTIEHIMPRQWTVENWPRPTDQDLDRRDTLLHSIGNLTLLNSKLNSGMSNRSWPEKRAAINRHSVLMINKDLLDHAPECQPWDEDAIRSRAERLWAIAIRIWPGPTRPRFAQQSQTALPTL